MNIETIIIAAIAIFVVWRLWSVLGTRTGAERPPMDAAPVGRVGGDVVDFRRPQAAFPIRGFEPFDGRQRDRFGADPRESPALEVHVVQTRRHGFAR